MNSGENYFRGSFAQFDQNVRLTSSGRLSIGTTAANALIQLDNSVVNRKIILFEVGNNDHQYYGFGINGSTLRYQVPAGSDSHVFFGATSSSSSNEQLRINNTGTTVSGTLNIASIDASLNVFTDGSKNLVTRPGFSYQFWTATADTPIPGATGFHTLANITKTQGGGQGELVQQGTGATFRNNNSVPMLFVINLSVQITTDVGSATARILNNGVELSRQQGGITIGVNPLLNVTATGRVVNGTDLVCQVSSGSAFGQNATAIRITITTYPLL